MNTNWRDRLFLAGMLGMFGTCSYFAAEREQATRIKPGTTEYEAYISQMIANCYHESVISDLKRSREELPVMPTRAETMALCRAVVIETDGLYPEARPKKQN